MGGFDKQIIEVPEGDFVGDHAPVEQELHELTKSHGIGLCFGERSVDFIEPLLVARLEHNRIMS